MTDRKNYKPAVYTRQTYVIKMGRNKNKEKYLR